MSESRLIALLILLLGVNFKANAMDHKTWEDISDYGVYILISSSLAAPTFRSDWEGLEDAALSLALAQGVAQLGKASISALRPDKSDNKSFPSGHTSTAFAAATTLHRRYGWKSGFPAYALATLTGSARVAARKHHWYDALAGVVIGAASGWLFTDKFNEKVQLVPWADSKGVGVSVTMIW